MPKLNCQISDYLQIPLTERSKATGETKSVGEVMANAFRSAEFDRPGAAFVSLPMDIMKSPAKCDVLTLPSYSRGGPADSTGITEAANLIN